MENKYTIPNILSSYRIIIFPFIIYLALSGQEKLFIIFLAINLISDILDGLIARVFNQKTKLGAKLDSLGDIGTYICAFTGIYLFKWEIISQHLIPFIIFGFLYIIFHLLAYIKFGSFPSLHTYMFKTTGYLQGIFIFVFFVWEFQLWLYYLALSWGILAAIEELLILGVLSESRSNVKGLFWVLKDKRV